MTVVLTSHAIAAIASLASSQTLTIEFKALGILAVAFHMVFVF